MNEPILLIMAAGMGSRYGGLKQIDPIGPGGEVILDYSLFDARRAGFTRAIVLIKPEMEQDFRQLIGNRAATQMEIRYAFQDKTMLPAGYAVPEGRVKPWGTGHAVLCCKEWIDAPFCVINADDFYGADAFRKAYAFLKSVGTSDPQQYMMVGYHLKNTVTENGSVARGVCTVDATGRLRDICERTHIITSADGPLFTEDGENYRRLDPDTLVSMNMWGFTPAMLDALESGFAAFLNSALKENPLKAEYYLPAEVSHQLAAGHAEVTVLACADKWFGVTYQADKPVVQSAIRQLIEENKYPKALWC